MSPGQRLLRWFLTLFGLVCAGIALVHIAFGPSSIPGSIPVNATMDSEDRSYATLFLGFGLAHLWAARDLVHRAGAVLALQATFFAGGLARIVSLLAVGPPIGLFVFLGALELLIPPLVWWGLRRAFPAG
jgi:Domain of unknown function (DUF4345)